MGEAYEQKYSHYDQNNNNMSKQFKSEPGSQQGDAMASSNSYQRKNVVQPSNFSRQYKEEPYARNDLSNQRYPPQNPSSNDYPREPPGDEHEMSGPEYDLPL